MLSISISGIINTIKVDNIHIYYNSTMLYINKTLREYNHTMKKQIDKDPAQWERKKKLLNPYEYINFSTNLSICDYKPISRSFFKLIEILNYYNFKFSSNINTFHLAEGPGGFIEAIMYYRNCDSDNYYAMSLNENNSNIPKLIKTNILDKENIYIENGADNTGNLLNIENIIYIYNKYKHSMDFVTGDGGFDFSKNFNNQEELSLNLIFIQVLYALILQKIGGSFILKVFDTYSYLSIEILYLLNYFYEDIHIVKPKTSRPANSEKYIVCINFKNIENIDQIINKFITLYNSNYKITSIFKNNYIISTIFIEKVKEINSIFGQKQNEFIQNVLNIFNHDDNKSADGFIIDKCKKWCNKNNLPIKNKYL